MNGKKDRERGKQRQTKKERQNREIRERKGKYRERKVETNGERETKKRDTIFLNKSAILLTFQEFFS